MGEGLSGLWFGREERMPEEREGEIGEGRSHVRRTWTGGFF